jgi:hypothetical protein
MLQEIMTRCGRQMSRVLWRVAILEICFGKLVLAIYRLLFKALCFNKASYIDTSLNDKHWAYLTSVSYRRSTLKILFPYSILEESTNEKPRPKSP